MGKGSTPRPFDVDADTYSDNWERTFGQTKPTGSLTKVENENGKSSQSNQQGQRSPEGVDQ